MFGMGFSEILIILVIGILFLGPDKLPEAMVKIAKFFNAFKKTINEAKDSIDQELKIEELKAEAMEYKKRLQETTDTVKRNMYIEEIEDIKNSTTNLNQTIKDSIEDSVKPKDEPKKDKKIEKKDIKAKDDKKIEKEEEKDV